MATVNAKWFQDRLSEMQMSQRQFAKKMKLDPSSVTLFLQGKRRLKTAEAALVAKLFGTSLVDVLEASGLRITDMPGESVIELKGSIGERLEVIWGRGIGEMIVRGERFGPNDEGLRVETSGTPFDGLDGALVVYRKGDGINPEAAGRLAIVSIARGKGSFLRVLRRGYKPGEFNLADLSGKIIESNVAVEAAWPIVYMKM